jgi:hypothetical protein
MKTISHVIVIIIIICSYAACKRGNDYYIDYSKDNVVYDGTIYEYLKSKPGQYDSLVLLIEMLPALKERLVNPKDSLTIFVANNRCFDLAIKNLNTRRKAAKLSSLYLEDLDRVVIDSLLDYYIFKGMINIDSIKESNDGVPYPSLKKGYRMNLKYNTLTASGLVKKGEHQIVFSDMNKSNYTRDWFSTTTHSTDLKVHNGYVQTLSQQHEFAFGKFINSFSRDKVK